MDELLSSPGGATGAHAAPPAAAGPGAPPSRPGAEPRGGAWGVVGRLVLLLVGFLVLTIAAAIPEAAVLDEPEPSVGAALGAAAVLVVVGGFGMLALVHVLRGRGRDRRAYGLGGPTPGRLLGLGLVAGGLMMGVVVAIDLATGLLQPERVLTDVLAPAAAAAVVVLVLASAASGAFGEEVVFRGAWVTELARLPLWAVVLLVSVPFSLVHLLNDDLAPSFFAATVLATAFTVLTRVLTGSLWFAIGWHSAWNALQRLVGVSTTEEPYDGHAFVQLERTGSDRWLGPGEAVEAGLVALAVLALGTVAVAVVAHRRGVRWAAAVPGLAEGAAVPSRH